jgi:protein associated with RNAse G/E
LGKEWQEVVEHVVTRKSNLTQANEIVVSVRKYDGHERRRWVAKVAKQEGSLFVLDAVFDEEIQHDLLGTIALGTISTEYYWLDRWYNIFRFSDPAGQLKNFYCNINEPPQFDGSTLSYIDLDIDVFVAPDLTYQILDMDDFEENARCFSYPEEVRAGAHRALAELTGLIESRSFPFNK